MEKVGLLKTQAFGGSLDGLFSAQTSPPWTGGTIGTPKLLRFLPRALKLELIEPKFQTFQESTQWVRTWKWDFWKKLSLSADDLWQMLT